jgi:hypothetical protein
MRQEKKPGINLYKICFCLMLLLACYLSIQVYEGWDRIDQKAHEVTRK